jgi:Ca2+-binding EF-hand superfamily protein
MATPVEKLREACLKRGVSGIKTIGRTFRIYDDNGSRMLDYQELKNGVADYGLNMSKSDLDDLFKCFDKDNSGSISFDEFLLALRPPMSRSRLELIDKAFAKMDNTGDGVITIDDLKKFYDVSHHPKFKTGDWTKERVLKEFLDSFQLGEKDDVVTKEEFVNYYAGVSASIDQDVYFDYMMRQAWKL